MRIEVIARTALILSLGFLGYAQTTQPLPRSQVSNGRIALSIYDVPAGDHAIGRHLAITIRNVSDRTLKIGTIHPEMDFVFSVSDSAGNVPQLTKAGEQARYWQTHRGWWLLSRGQIELAPGEDFVHRLALSALASWYQLDPGKPYTVVLSPNRYPAVPDEKNSGTPQPKPEADPLSLSLVVTFPGTAKE